MKLKAGVIGAGHLGKIHIKLLNQSEKYDLVGFYDSDFERAEELSQEFKIPYFKYLDELLQAIEMADVVTPTLSHSDVALKALEADCHVFIEKPISNTVAEAERIIAKAKELNKKAQVGHVERFNPAFLASKDFIENPLFIETHRLAEFNPRGTDVPVVLDLMIHDLDVILSLVKSPLKNIHSSGVSVISETPDIANARLEFENGCVANITTSRISMKNMRKSRFFQSNAYIAVDFLEKKTEIIRMQDAPENPSNVSMILENAEGNKKEILFEFPEVHQNNAILDELESFHASITENKPIAVTLEDGKKALEVAYKIIENFKI